MKLLVRFTRKELHVEGDDESLQRLAALLVEMDERLNFVTYLAIETDRCTEVQKEV